MDTLATHPAANIFPEMDGPAFDELKKDINDNGQREKITLHHGQILDGRNRYRACLELDIKPQTRDWNGDDPVKYVVSLNLHRRHLNTSQRAMVAARVAQMKQGRPWPGKVKASIDAFTQPHSGAAFKIDDAATLLNVGPAIVQRARRVQRDGVPELVEAVDRGEVTVNTALSVAQLPPEEQVAAVVTAKQHKRRSSPVSSQRGPNRSRRSKARIGKSYSNTTDEVKNLLHKLID